MPWWVVLGSVWESLGVGVGGEGGIHLSGGVQGGLKGFIPCLKTLSPQT